MNLFMPVYSDTFHDVAKEIVASFSFSREDVFKDDFSKTLRIFHLKKAETLGNHYKNKVKIIFKLANGDVKRVYTTVWAFTSDHISLKAGVIIPIRSILGIEY